jgi:hypothetical protein
VIVIGCLLSPQGSSGLPPRGGANLRLELKRALVAK